jgi:hypothetical protein
MKNGNWIALHKELRYFLPSGREYTILEAMFSYTLDRDNGKEGTISGYSKLWGWSRTKVRKFVEELKTGEGHLTNRQRTGKRHQILLKLNNLQERKDTLKTGKEQLKDTHVDTTIKPNPKPEPNKKESYAAFEIFWEAYPKRDGKKLGKQATKEKFLKLSPEDVESILVAVKNYTGSKTALDGYAKDPERFLKKDFWKDWIEVADYNNPNEPKYKEL